MSYVVESLNAMLRHFQVAEGVGFEPTVGKPTPVFKTGTFVRSVIPPWTIVVETPVNPFCARAPVTAGRG
jgi:hypothetical protein